ncbi:MAG: protein translocase subunit SecD [Planctomycetota bacterium]
MIENPKRALAFVLLLVALGAVCIQAFGFRLGLDLAGGARLLYSVDVEQAKKDGILDAKAEAEKIVPEMIQVISERIDPNGVLDPSITQAGSSQILIELPGTQQEELAQIQDRIEKLGRLEMRIVAEEKNKQSGKLEWEYDRQVEEQRLLAWLDKNKALVDEDPLQIEKYNRAAGTDEGPRSKWLNWAPMYRKENPDAGKEGQPKWLYEHHSSQAGPAGGPYFLPLDMKEVFFTGEQLNGDRVKPTVDQYQRDALAYELRAEFAGAYRDWSAKYIGTSSAIILNGWVRSAPVFESAIPGNGIITGRFSPEELKELSIVLKTGSLKLVPRLESKATVGAAVGRVAIEKGEFSMLIGGLLVLAFMLVYYRQSGLIANTALIVNIFLVLGALALMKATLTLPGLAGIVLTIGMAVDANILIYERIREEQDRGKDLVRSIEAGFEKALSTILDANITTFLTGVILYQVGIGPIRGFAVTLMIGIVTSVFSALYVSKLMFTLFYANKKEGHLSMSRFLGATNFRFLHWRVPAMVISGALIVAGIASFIEVDHNVKYGIDFTGGASVRVALDQPMSEVEAKDLLDGDAEFSKEYPTKQITTVGDIVDGRARGFSIKLKLTEEQKEAAQTRPETSKAPYITHLERLFGERLASEPFSDVKKVRGDPATELVLHALQPISLDAIRTKLGKARGISSATAVPSDKKGTRLPDATQGQNFFIEYDADADLEKAQAAQLLAEGLRGLTDVNGNPIELSSAFPEDTLIGSRAVGELRDAAIAAILIALGVIVVYIRVRFHEYKYGIAACAALVHDVCIVLGLVVVFNGLGLVHAEIDLPMIAAFLTIIGYSLNDTIVVFDRIRENLELEQKFGRGEGGFSALIDRSVNQNLSRTVLTSFTTFIVVTVIFFLNRGAESVLEGFAFAMMGGIVVGTYSSVYIANPLVLILHRREQRLAPKAEAKGAEVTTGS